MAGPPRQRVICAIKNELEGGIILIIAGLNNIK